MKKKKVAIITHPLQYNYGGVLQAYALSTILKRYFDDVVVLRFSYFSLKDLVKILLETISPFHKFKRKYICEKKVLSSNLENRIKKNEIDTIVVGSDQVWRSDFGLNNLTFGQFLSVGTPITIFAYAASFGNAQWKYSEEETRIIKSSIRKFAGVSVREKSAVALCRKYMEVEAKWVLDPTMLLLPDMYLKFVTQQPNKKIFCYLLDYENSFNRKIMSEIQKQYDMPVKTTRLIKNRVLKRFAFTLSIEGWLSNIYNAEVVLTDSFHGCVFCIIFNRNFFVLENESGGNTRIKSLLEYFNLENRIIRRGIESHFNKISAINWGIVNEKMKIMRNISLDYILTSITKHPLN